MSYCNSEKEDVNLNGGDVNEWGNATVQSMAWFVGLRLQVPEVGDLDSGFVTALGEAGW